MRMLLLFFTVCLLFTDVVHGQTADTTALKTALQAKLDEWHKAGSFPGATLGVVLANGESFGLAVGYSDRDARTPMKRHPDTFTNAVPRGNCAVRVM